MTMAMSASVPLYVLLLQATKLNSLESSVYDQHTAVFFIKYLKVVGIFLII